MFLIGKQCILFQYLVKLYGEWKNFTDKVSTLSNKKQYSGHSGSATRAAVNS